MVTYRNRGRQHKKTFRTLTDARDGKRKLEQAVADGFGISDKILLHDFATEWIERYQGTGRRGYREETRDGDRAILNRYALKFFPPRIKLQEVTPKDVSRSVEWLVKQPVNPKAKKEKQVKTLSDSTIRNAVEPLRACLSTTRREGLIVQNPAVDITLPHRPRIGDQEQAKPFPGETMELVVDLINPKYRLIFRLLAATGIRRSELLALEGRHLELDEQSHTSRSGRQFGSETGRVWSWCLLSRSRRGETSRSRQVWPTL